MTLKTLLVLLYFSWGFSANSQTDSSKLFEMKKGTLSGPILAPSGKLKIEISKSSDSSYAASYQMDSSYVVIAIFDGLVITSEIVGWYYQVTTKYGNYFITYDGLQKPLVKKGDFVKAGQTISAVGNNLHNTYFFNLFIYDTKNSFDPMLWLKH